jgi:hypothetical protein
MASPIQALAEEIRAGFANFKPENISDLRGMFEDFPGFWEEVGNGIGQVAAMFDDELPVDHKVAEAIREMGAAAVGLRDHCDEMRSLFEQAHETELSRIDNPRVNEDMWDVGKGQG